MAKKNPCVYSPCFYSLRYPCLKHMRPLHAFFKSVPKSPPCAMRIRGACTKLAPSQGLSPFFLACACRTGLRKFWSYYFGYKSPKTKPKIHTFTHSLNIA